MNSFDSVNTLSSYMQVYLESREKVVKPTSKWHRLSFGLSAKLKPSAAVSEHTRLSSDIAKTVSDAEREGILPSASTKERRA